MSEETKYTPSAFPVLENHGGHLILSDPGMLLLDYLAAKAMQALVNALVHPTGFHNSTPESLATKAYEIGLAMLKEREKHI